MAAGVIGQSSKFGHMDVVNVRSRPGDSVSTATSIRITCQKCPWVAGSTSADLELS